MSDSFPYLGRDKAAEDTEPYYISPEVGKAICLVVCVGDYEVVSFFADQAIITRWGIRLIRPFRRLSVNMSYDYAEYLGKDIYVFCPARLQIIPMEGWMLR